jgi:ubiquinone/menaquinone biosynthesis C-methylase UbiE
MAVHRQSSIAQWFLKSVFGLLIGKENQHFYESIHWDEESDRFRKKHLAYPAYYSSQNFHGIERGYLNPIAAITYDAVTAIASPPSEKWLRQQMFSAIQGHPQQILDLGCGTGTTTRMLKQAFPQAKVIGLDLSPYMLVVAAEKARTAKLSIEWRHGLAEATGLEDVRFDLVTASFLLHETPPSVSVSILKECFRLLKPRGQVLILDGNQQRLRHAGWLISLFREPYSQVYAAENIQHWFDTAGFTDSQTNAIGWIHQLSSAIK